jgi:hypothetical protein
MNSVKKKIALQHREWTSVIIQEMKAFNCTSIHETRVSILSVHSHLGGRFLLAYFHAVTFFLLKLF